MTNWIPITERLPETKPWSYEVEMSDKVLVTYLAPDGSYAYPWVAHLHSDNKGQYANYAVCWSSQVAGKACTWLSPYVDIKEGTKITHWMPLPDPPEDG